MPLTGKRRAEYDRKYYQTKKAKKVESRKVFFPIRLPESIVAQAQIMASEATQLGKYPGTWRTATGVLRGLIVKGLEKLKEEGDQAVGEALAVINLEHHLGSIGRARRQALSALAQARVEITSLLDIGSEDEAVQYYVATMDAVSIMAHTVWTDWLVQEMQKAFPDLHKRVTAGTIPGLKLRRRKADRGKR